MSKVPLKVAGKITKNGKGSFYRIKTTDKKYKENYDKIFRKNK
tara:strand:+ start:1168 stop:1296 length:129 start_codon:yes stop_codon:yes gene_type:complete